LLEFEQPKKILVEAMSEVLSIKRKYFIKNLLNLVKEDRTSNNRRMGWYNG